MTESCVTELLSCLITRPGDLSQVQLVSSSSWFYGSHSASVSWSVLSCCLEACCALSGIHRIRYAFTGLSSSVTWQARLVALCYSVTVSSLFAKQISLLLRKNICWFSPVVSSLVCRVVESNSFGTGHCLYVRIPCFLRSQHALYVCKNLSHLHHNGHQRHRKNVEISWLWAK